MALLARLDNPNLWSYSPPSLPKRAAALATRQQNRVKGVIPYPRYTPPYHTLPLVYQTIPYPTLGILIHTIYPMETIIYLQYTNSYRT